MAELPHYVIVRGPDLHDKRASVVGAWRQLCFWPHNAPLSALASVLHDASSGFSHSAMVANPPVRRP